MGGAWWAVTPAQAPGAFVRVMWESGTVVYLQVGFCALVLGAPPRWSHSAKWQTGDSEMVPW